MDRKKDSIITSAKALDKNTKLFKSDQFFGYDTTQLILAQTSSSYDATASIANNARHDFYVVGYDANYLESAYAQVMYQLWINNMSTPYAGKSSGVSVFTAVEYDSVNYWRQAVLQILNQTGSTITVFIKGYSISTWENPEVVVF